MSRHAEASAATVVIEVGDDAVVLRVTDDGVGFTGERAGGHGVGNMIDRAQALGGTCAIAVPERGGTEVRWQVPLGDGS